MIFPFKMGAEFPLKANVCFKCDSIQRNIKYIYIYIEHINTIYRGCTDGTKLGKRHINNHHSTLEIDTCCF